MKTGAFSKELMMGTTMRNLGNTIKEANAAADNSSMLQEEEEAEEDQYQNPHS